MADLVLQQDGQLPVATRVRYRDMGDGTYALVGATIICGQTGSSSGNVPLPFLVNRDGEQVVINEYEYWLHESARFKASYLRPHGSELANDASMDFLVKVGATFPDHLRIRLSAGGDCELMLTEASPVSANGVLIASVSKNRQNVGVAETQVYHSPTLAGVGIGLFSWWVPGGEKKGTGGDWGDTHWVMRTNTDYLISVINRSGGAIQFSLGIGWGEHA